MKRYQKIQLDTDLDEEIDISEENLNEEDFEFGLIENTNEEATEETLEVNLTEE